MDIKALLAALSDVEGLADKDMASGLKGKLAAKKSPPPAVEVDITKEAPEADKPAEAHVCPTCGQPMPDDAAAMPPSHKPEIPSHEVG
jgi:hypothetical protein